MNCLTCNNPHDGSYGSGRFCNEHCARKYARNLRKKEVDEKITRTINKIVHNAELLPENTLSLCEYGCGQKARFKLANGNDCCSNKSNKCPKLREKNTEGLKKYYRVNPVVSRQARMSSERYKEINKKLGEERIQQQSLLPWNETLTSEKCRRILLEQNGKCAICNTSEWMGKPLKLHLDHINGNRNNQERINLRYICPNCHSQTDTYCRGKSKNISDEDLKNSLIKNNLVIHKTLKEFGLVCGGYNWLRAKKIIEKNNLSISGWVAKLADAAGLGPAAARRRGSTPLSATIV